jgi:hypothetical protein
LVVEEEEGATLRNACELIVDDNDDSPRNGSQNIFLQGKNLFGCNGSDFSSISLS